MFVIGCAFILSGRCQPQDLQQFPLFRRSHSISVNLSDSAPFGQATSVNLSREAPWLAPQVCDARKDSDFSAINLRLFTEIKIFFRGAANICRK